MIKNLLKIAFTTLNYLITLREKNNASDMNENTHIYLN